MGKPDRAGDLALVGCRRSSAALNDDFVDIGDFQQFSAYRIEMRPAMEALATRTMVPTGVVTTNSTTG